MIYNLLSEPLTIIVGGANITLESAGHLSFHGNNMKVGCPGYNVLSQLQRGDAIIVEEAMAKHIAKFCDLKMTIVFTPTETEPNRLKYHGIY